MVFCLLGILGSGDLDNRALDALRGLLVPDALAVLAELRQTNLEHVSNKSAYLCGLIKTYRQKHRIAVLNRGATANGNDMRAKLAKPDEAKIKVRSFSCSFNSAKFIVSICAII